MSSATTSTPTPHIEARPGDFAKTVLMPGDPLRAKFVADKYLENVKQVNGVRNMLGFTGTYKGKPVSVMGSGMGMPSIGIYSYELFNFYDVDNIVRIGSAGSISKNCHVHDVVLAQGACTTSSWQEMYNLRGNFAPIADWKLLNGAYRTAERLGMKVVVGNCLSEDAFYDADPEAWKRWAAMGVLCLEMEAAALYMNAAKAGKRGLGIFTISDEIYSGRALSSADRQTSFHQMMELALEMIE